MPGLLTSAMTAMSVVFSAASTTQTSISVRTEEIPAMESILDIPAHLRISNVPRVQALTSLSEASGVGVAFSSTLLSGTNQEVSCDCEFATVGEALERILWDAPLRYRVVDGQVVITPLPSTRREWDDWRRPSVMLANSAPTPGLLLAPPLRLIRQTWTVLGTVVDSATGEPLAGAQVTIPETEARSVSDEQGTFRLNDLSSAQVEVRVVRLGYKPTTRTVPRSAPVTRFALDRLALGLDEIVVTGTAGEARSREVGNSISQISLAQIAQPVANVANLLQGRATGTTVSVQSAEIGTGPVIRLRGNVSVSQGNQPLIYVDGVRQATDNYRRGMLQKEPGALSDINPADIARVEIIKGAAAATLYGSEAAAGVIQIFTKRGQSAAPQFTVQTDHTLAWVRPFGSTSRPFLDMEPWLQTAYGQKHFVSANGGQERFRYFVSGSFEDREGVQVQDEETRYSIRTNVTLQATPRLSFDLNSMFTRDELVTAPTGNALEGIMFNIYRAPNNFVGGAMPGDPGFFDQINSLRAWDSQTSNQRQILGVTATWNPVQEFTNRLVVGYDRMSQEQETIMPFGYPTSPDGRIDVGSWFATGLSLDLTSSYQLRFSESIGTTLSAGGQLNRRKTFEFEATGLGLPGPGEHNLSSTAQRSVSQESQLVNTGGLFFQGRLDFHNRYFLTAGIRFDGSSAFGKDFGLEVYPKVSASYVISDESFWPASWGTVKLRGAYGAAGRAPGAFDAARTWSASSFNSQTAFSPANVGNPLLGPERTGELEVGFDGAFFDERWTMDVTYYRQLTREALLGVGQAPTLGFGGTQLENVGKLRNTGVEIATNVTVLRRPNFGWDIGASLSTNNSKILDMGGVISYSLVEGGPVPARRGRRVTNKDAFADPEYEVDYIFGPSQPTRIVNASMSFRLPGGISLTARGEYQAGHWIEDFVQSRIATQRTGHGALSCDDRAYVHVPHTEYDGPGDTHANLDRLNAWERALCYPRAPSGVWFYPGDFAKLREITVQAPVPVRILGIERATVTASVSNLFRWTHRDFRGQDPEVSHARDQTNTLQSIVSDQVPAPASFTVSVRAVF